MLISYADTEIQRYYWNDLYEAMDLLAVLPIQMFVIITLQQIVSLY